MTERTVNAGDWLEHSHYGRVRVAGFDEDGDPVFAIDQGARYQSDLMSSFVEETRPLPGCDSWDWVEPVKQFVPRYFVPVGLPPWGTTERYVYVSDPDGRIDCVYSSGRRKRQDIRVEKMAADALTWREIFEPDATAILMPTADEKWPKYYKSEADHAFVLRDSPTSAVYVHRDGIETPFGPWESEDASRQEMTEAEAKSRLNPSIATCPDCGEFRGHGHDNVCRRRDLPPVTATLMTRKPVRLFRDSHGFVYVGAYDKPNADTEVIVDCTTVYLQEPAS